MRTLTFFLAALCLCSVAQANPFWRLINRAAQHLSFNKQFSPNRLTVKTFSSDAEREMPQFYREPQSPQEQQALENQLLIRNFPSDIGRGADIQVEEVEEEPRTAAEFERFLDRRHMRYLHALRAENNQIFGTNPLQARELDGQPLGDLQGPSEMHVWLWKGF